MSSTTEKEVHTGQQLLNCTTQGGFEETSLRVIFGRVVGPIAVYRQCRCESDEPDESLREELMVRKVISKVWDVPASTCVRFLLTSFPHLARHLNYQLLRIPNIAVFLGDITALS